MITANLYNKKNKNKWDEFVKNSKNGTFMLSRDYMDYHSDRFEDFSLMFYEDEKLIALMPASKHGDEILSHGGLTYGGIITNRKMTTPKMLGVFEALKEFLKSRNIDKLLYKRVPSIYFNYSSDEDLYALFISNATLKRRDVSTTIDLSDKIEFNERRKRNIKKAVKSNLIFKQTYDFETYINLLTDVLKFQHEAKPVHTTDEIKMLADKFPDNIKLYASYIEKKMLSGVIIFETPTVAHAQYIANSEEGKKIGALDFVFDKLINKIYKDKKYFDFGISNEDNGRYLNLGLVGQKQEFGGRAIVHDFYELEMK